MGLIAAELIKAGAEEGSPGRFFNPARVAELIMEEGVPKAALRLTMVLGMALTGGVTASGELKPIAK
jgi:hypothetical protein